MIGIKWIEAEFEGVLLKGHLRFDGTSTYTLQIEEPFQGPEVHFHFPRIHRSLLTENTSEFESFAEAQLARLYKLIVQLLTHYEPENEKLSALFERIESIPVITKDELSEQRMFLKRSLNDMLIDKSTYDIALRDLKKLMVEKMEERESLCREFFRSFLPELTHSANLYSWLDFLKAQTSAKLSYS
jgi:hypothetical protein